jgi:hypothetical protein
MHALSERLSGYRLAAEEMVEDRFALGDTLNGRQNPLM